MSHYISHFWLETVWFSVTCAQKGMTDPREGRRKCFQAKEVACVVALKQQC